MGAGFSIKSRGLNALNNTQLINKRDSKCSVNIIWARGCTAIGWKGIYWKFECSYENYSPLNGTLNCENISEFRISIYINIIIK